MNEISPKKRESPKAAKSKLKTSAMFQILKTLVLLIVFFGVIALAYINWQQRELITELTSRQNQVLVDNENLAAQIVAIQQDLDFLSNTEASSDILFNQQNARLDSLNEELVSLRLNLNANQSSGIWQLAEASSLLRIAQQYMELNHDIPAALVLYENSRSILAQIDDPALNRIVNRLASDIQKLGRTQLIDTEGFFMRLSDISQQLDSVSLETTIEPSSAFLEAGASNIESGYFQNVREFLSRYFTVRRLDAPIDLPLSKQQISYLRQNMQMQIEQAKLALLQGRQAVYQDSISNVLMLAQQNIPEQEQEKSLILRALRELQDETILFELPILSDSQVMLQNLMDDNDSDTRN
jgi:uroporphyrin-3 C-methyltransferase